MGVAAFCLVTVQITAIGGVVLPDPITVFAEAAFPEVNGFVTIEVLGVPLTIPCPTVDLVETITVEGIGEVTLLIQAQPANNA
ncbi:hypothetical protein [Halalkalibacter flavus]|uniref:hypothetical protein n=1 Tax=Halalkalibacter flavus TaxID=3090668 RepID=UPI002FCB49B3